MKIDITPEIKLTDCQVYAIIREWMENKGFVVSDVKPDLKTEMQGWYQDEHEITRFDGVIVTLKQSVDLDFVNPSNQ